jgi:hypothetical protein
MTSTIRRKTTGDPATLRVKNKSNQFDDSELARRKLRLNELNKDYHHQLKNLKRVAQLARSNFKEYGQLHSDSGS